MGQQLTTTLVQNPGGRLRCQQLTLIRELQGSKGQGWSKGCLSGSSEEKYFPTVFKYFNTDTVGYRWPEYQLYLKIYLSPPFNMSYFCILHE